MIILDNVTFGYDRHPAVHHLRGRFQAGSMTAIVGPNGAGKSTLLKGIVGLLRPLEGRVVIDGFDRRDIAYGPQLSEMDLDFPMSVIEAVSMGGWRQLGAFGAVTPRLLDHAAESLHHVGLDGFAERSLASLSVGQRQRAMFARVMMADAPAILLDEPFAAVDSSTTLALLGLLKHWRAEGRTVIAVLHDFAQVQAHFPDVLLLAREIVAWGPAVEVMTESNVAALNRMAEAWEDHAPVCERGRRA